MRLQSRCHDDVVTLTDEIAASERQQWDALGEFLASYARSRPISKVGVVGNAPLSSSTVRAAELDSCDLVIRANSLVLDEPGDQPCMGTTCHAVLLSRSTRMTPWVFQNYRRRAYLLMQAGFTVFRTLRDTAAHWPADLGAMPVPNRVVVQRLTDLLQVDREPASVLPTTGTTGVFLAHELFPEADLVVTGFSFLTHREQKQWAHHAGGITEVNPQHRIDLEGALLESWITDGSMRFLD